jgi:hypothetical protein
MADLTPNMNLVAWSEDSDPYSHSQLSANFSAIDSHDHTDSNGVQIPTGGIADGAITEDKLSAGALSSISLANGSVTGAKLASGAVTTSKIADGAVTGPKVGSNTLTADNLATDSVTGAELRGSSSDDSLRTVAASHIKDGAVTPSKLASSLHSSYQLAFQHVLRPNGPEKAGYHHARQNGQYLGDDDGDASPMPMFRFEAGHYDVPGLDTKLSLQVQCKTNSNTASTNFTLGLHKVYDDDNNTGGGGNGEIKYKLHDPRVSGSAVTFNDPGPDTLKVDDSGDFDAPADGTYTIGVKQTGDVDGNAVVAFTVQVLVRHA